MIINQTFGASGETASIVVTAPTGSTVTCTTPSGIVLTATEIGGTWTFARLKVYGTYVVTATNGTKTATENVLVDAAEQFEVEIDYNKLKLYWEGNEYTSVTGGWSQCELKYNNQVFSTSTSTLTKNQTTIGMSLNKVSLNGMYGIAIGCVNKIDLTNYSKIYITYAEANLSSDSTSDINNQLQVGTVLGDYLYSVTNTGYSSGQTGQSLTNVTYECNINLGGEYYIWIMHENCAGGTVTVKSGNKISRVWLE